MFSLIIIVALAAIGAGFAVKWIVDNYFSDVGDINKNELIIGSLICSVLIIPLITWGGFTMIRNSTISYNEYYSGMEKSATEYVTECYRDGPCVHEYDCDPYIVMVTKTRQVYAGTDSKGNAQYRTETYQEPETRYHSCPYTTTEHTFVVKDTLGDTYTMGDHWFPENPSQHRWRNKSFPSGIPKGKPALWVAAKERIDSGNPGGTTKRMKYDNYIQASQEDIFAKHSDAIESYVKKGFMPKVTTKVYDFYLADKLYLPTGVPAGMDRKHAQEQMMRLNGAVGGDKHGDLSVVLVDATKVPNADEYTEALDAYWQSDALGKNTLSKNGIVVVAGYEGDTVKWSRGFTGMPVGNEGFEQAARGLAGGPVEIDTLLPAIKGLIFAPEPSGFKRVEMKDYEYLFSAIQPSGWQKFWIAFVAFVLSMIVWGLMLVADIRFDGKTSNSYKYNYRRF